MPLKHELLRLDSLMTGLVGVMVLVNMCPIFGSAFYQCTGLTEMRNVFDSTVGMRTLLNITEAASGEVTAKLRGRSWMEQAKVVGHERYTGYPSTRMSALLCRTPDDREFKIDVGFTDEQRTPPSEGTWYFAGDAIVTYRYSELTEDDVPRSPTFVREDDMFNWEQYCESYTRPLKPRAANLYSKILRESKGICSEKLAHERACSACFELMGDTKDQVIATLTDAVKKPCMEEFGKRNGCDQLPRLNPRTEVALISPSPQAFQIRVLERSRQPL